MPPKPNRGRNRAGPPHKKQKDSSHPPPSRSNQSNNAVKDTKTKEKDPFNKVNESQQGTKAQKQDIGFSESKGKLLPQLGKLFASRRLPESANDISLDKGFGHGGGLLREVGERGQNGSGFQGLSMGRDGQLSDTGEGLGTDDFKKILEGVLDHMDKVTDKSITVDITDIFNSIMGGSGDDSSTGILSAKDTAPGSFLSKAIAHLQRQPQIPVQLPPVFKTTKPKEKVVERVQTKEADKRPTKEQEKENNKNKCKDTKAIGFPPIQTAKTITPTAPHPQPNTIKVTPTQTMPRKPVNEIERCTGQVREEFKYQNNDIVLLECVRHKKVLDKFCKNCASLMCDKCIQRCESVRHDVAELSEMLVKDVIDFNDRSAVNNQYMLCVYDLHKVSKDVEELHLNEESLRAKYEEAEIETQRQLEMINGDRSTLQELTGHIPEYRARMKSWVGKACLEEMSRFGNFEARFVSAISTTEGSLRAKRDLLNTSKAHSAIMENRINLEMHVALIDTVNELSPSQKIYIHMSKFYKMTDFRPMIERCVGRTWVEYQAFAGASSVPFISKLLSQPLHQIEKNLFASDPITLPIDTGRNKIFATADKDGIFIATSKRHKGYFLTLHNLFTNEHNEIGPFPSIVQPVCVCDSLFLLMQHTGNALTALVKDVMKADSITVFSHHNCPAIFNSIDNSKVGDDGGFHYVSPAQCINYSSLLNSFSNTSFTSKATKILSTTGINIPCVDCVAQDPEWNVVAFHSHRNIQKIFTAKTHAFALITSVTRPHDLSKAMYLLHPNTVHLCGKTFKMSYPFTPASIQSIVRVYRDVFVAYDSLDCSWKALRLHVL